MATLRALLLKKANGKIAFHESIESEHEVTISVEAEGIDSLSANSQNPIRPIPIAYPRLHSYELDSVVCAKPAQFRSYLDLYGTRTVILRTETCPPQ